MKTTIVAVFCAAFIAGCSCDCETKTKAGDETATGTETMQNDQDNTASGMEKTTGSESKKGSRYDTIYLDNDSTGRNKRLEERKPGTDGAIDSTHKRSGGKGTPHP